MPKARTAFGISATGTKSTRNILWGIWCAGIGKAMSRKAMYRREMSKHLFWEEVRKYE